MREAEVLEGLSNTEAAWCSRQQQAIDSSVDRLKAYADQLAEYDSARSLLASQMKVLDESESSTTSLTNTTR